MKKSLLLLLLFILNYSANAQVQNQFNGVLSIGAAVSPGVGADFTVYGYYNDLNGYYTPDSISIGNEIYDSKCERYSVVSVTSTVGVVVLQVDSIGIASDAPSNGKGVIFEPTNTYKYPLISSGLSSTLLACIESYRAILIDEDVASGSGYWSKKDSIVYYDNDVAIGIDTANLTLGLLSKGLHINGQEYAELKFTNQTSGTTTTDGASIYTDSNNDIVLKNNESNGEIRFQTGGSTRMRIEQDGDVGIGVNTPTEKLHVIGNTIFAGEMELDSFPNTRDDLVSPVNFLSTDASGNLQSLPIDSIPSGGASLWTENVSDIYYNSGKVGIGTNSPTSTLEVNDNTSTWSSDTAAVNVTSNWSGVGNFYDRIGLKFNLNSTGSNANIIGMDFNYNISGTNSNGFLMRSNLVNNGRLGGVTMESTTESTETMLTSKNYYSFKNSHLYSGAASTHYNQHIYGFYNDIEVASQLNTGANAFKPHIYGYYNTLNVPSSTNTTEYGLYLNTVNGGSDDFGVYSVGNVTNYFAGSVGIGINAPETDFHIKGTDQLVIIESTNDNGRIDYSINGDRKSRYQWDATESSFKSYPTGSNLLFATGANGDIVFRTGSADNSANDRMTITGNGDVGIGLSDPDEDLEVNGNIKLSSSLPYIRFNGNNSASTFDIKHNNSTKLEFYYNGNRLSYYTPIGTTGQFAFKQYSTGATADNYPGFSFDGDEDTGMGLYGADQLFLTTGGSTRLLATSTDIKINDYPNTRDDLVSPVNFLSTDASGNILSMPIDSLNIGSGGGDNLGDHTATTTLTMGTNRINRSGDGVLDGLGFSSQDEVEIYNNLGTVEVLFDIPNTTGAQIEVEQAAFGTDQEGVPAYSFSGDDDTGMFREATNELGFSTFGSRRMLLKQDSIYLDDFPNTRDDNVTAVNFLSTNANGRLQSLPITDLSGGIYGGSGSIPSDITVTGGAFDLDFDALADARFQSMTGQFHVGTSQNSSIAISLNTTSSGGDIDLDSADDIRLEAADDINIISETSSVNIEAANLINIGANTDTNTIDIGDDEDDIIRLGGVDLTDYDADLPNFLGITSTSGTIGLINHEEVPPSVGGVTTAGGFSAANRTFVNTINSGTPSTALPSAGSYQKDGDILTYCNKSASTDHDVTGHIEDTASNTVTVSPGDCVRFFWDETNDTWWIL